MFFGRLEARKGVGQSVAALNALDPELTPTARDRVVGRPSPEWTPHRIEAMPSDTVRRSIRRLSFATDLDRPGALARLSRDRSLAVMPSLETSRLGGSWKPSDGMNFSRVFRKLRSPKN